MLGGYQILDLRNIDLSRATTEATITDVEVLKQLSQIADHIQKTYDFSKPLHNQLKPLLIRYRDKKVGEKHEVALYGNIEVINTYYKFRIIANNEGEQLVVNVEFEEKTDEYENKYWDIKTAKILLTSEVAIFENITDKDGHKRFIEGDITLDTVEGVTQTFGKWSLSGSHLLIVIAGNVANGTTLISEKWVTITSLPSWIVDKIKILLGNYVDVKYSQPLWDSGLGVQSMGVYLRKIDNKLEIHHGAITLNADRTFRFNFDLLIDNE